MTGTASDGAGTAVEVVGLRKRYGRFPAIDGLDLHVPEGGVVGLIGPNGAGKTTTMLILATLLQPDAGQVRVFGVNPLRSPRDVRALVGWMPDFFGLYDGLTVEEYLDFFAAAYRLHGAQRRRRVADLLELVELGHKRSTDVRGLSRGMQQRLGLARCLVHSPRLVILDEPASGLDPRARVDLREVLRELARQGTTILLSSHILAELAELVDRIAVLEAGRVVAQGTLEELQRASRPRARVSLRVLGGHEALGHAGGIAAAAGATSQHVDGHSLHLELPGGDEAAADLLCDLVTAGVRVASYTEVTAGLEQLFLDVTDGVVSR